MREASAYLTTALCLSSKMAVLVMLAPGRELDFDQPTVGFGCNEEELAIDGPLDGDNPVYATPEEFAQQRDVGVRSSLSGKLLVAAPDLRDPYFAGTVIYMLADDEDGAL